MNKTFYKFLLAYFVVSVGIIILGGGAFGVTKYQEAKREIKILEENPLATGDKEFQDIINKVGNHIILPENETPTIATVSDVDKLKENQPFFRNAKNGDKVLIYESAKKAFLYNPEEDKIVDVGFVNFSDQSGLKKEGN